MLMATLLPGQPEDGETSLNATETSPIPERSERPTVQIQTAGPHTWVNTDFYAQVSNVMPSGGVVLSPGQQFRIQEDTSATEKETQKKAKEREESKEFEEKKQKEQQFQLLVVDPEGSGYTTESNAQQISTPPSSPMPGEGYQAIHPQPQTKPAATVENNPSPYILPDSPQSQFFAPVADYTVVQEVDNKHSLLVNPPPHQSPPPCLLQHPLKTLPAMPVGYITPDLLGNLAPWNDNTHSVDESVRVFPEFARIEMWKTTSFTLDSATSINFDAEAVHITNQIHSLLYLLAHMQKTKIIGWDCDCDDCESKVISSLLNCLGSHYISG